MVFSAAENACYGTLCILTACLPTFSFPVHFRAGNTGVLLMIFWCFLGLFNKGVNALAFNHNLQVHWTFGCDISAVIERIWQIGLCCSSLCILQKLESIASLRQAHSSNADRRRRLCIDLSVGLGVPILQIPLFFVVQPYRLDVIENIGCSAPLYNSVPALFVYYLWRLLISVLCSVFAVLILRWFVLRRRQFTAALSSQHSGLSQKKYFRLFALAVCEATLVSVAQFYLIIDSLRLTGLLPYSNWAQVHINFDTIAYVPMIREGGTSHASVSLTIFRWLSLSPALALFFFFGLTEDAKATYQSFWQAIKKMGQAFQPRMRNRGSGKHINPENHSLDLEHFQDQNSKVSIVLHKDIVIT
uniref:Pheromone receptor Pra2 n=1 Tax=Ustilago esculenta TaxID=185366 RepID=A0A481SH54_9BASI|nr:pheromone receptor Pra2 [Ustilago esculenta]